MINNFGIQLKLDEWTGQLFKPFFIYETTVRDGYIFNILPCKDKTLYLNCTVKSAPKKEVIEFSSIKS